MIVMQRFFCRKPQDSPTNPERRERRRRSVLPTTRFLQLTLREESAAGANGAEGDWSPALLGSQPITVGWVLRRTKLRTLCKYRLDTSTGARRRRSAEDSAGLRGVAPSGVQPKCNQRLFRCPKKRYGAAVPKRCRVLNPAGGSGRGAPTGVWGGNPKQVSGRQP